MTQVNERNERLRSTLAAAAEGLGELAAEQRDAASGGAELLEAVIAYADTVVLQTDGDLITDAAINAIEAAAQPIAADPAVAVASSRTYADNLIASVATLPAARDRDLEQSVKEAAATLRRSASQRLHKLEEEVAAKTSEIDQALADVRAGVETATTETKSALDAQATAFEARLTEFETTLAAQRQEISAALERQSRDFREAQGKTEAELRDFLHKAQEEVGGRVAEIRRMEAESSGLVHSTSVGLTAERFGDEADKQTDVADSFRRYTIALALGAVGMAIFAVVHQVEDSSAVVAKLGVSLVLGALATYTARQSGRHRSREEKARSLQLELTAFAPFIEPLDDDLKELERVLMTRKTFGNTGALPGEDDDHRYGLGPILDVLRKRIAKRLEETDAEP